MNLATASVATALLAFLLFGPYTAANSSTYIRVTHRNATSNTIYLHWKRRVHGEEPLTNFKVEYVGHTDYYDKTGTKQNTVSNGMETTRANNIVFSNLAACTEYTITITGWNTVTSITSKPLVLQTLANVVEPATPSITTQIRSDGNTHAVVAIDPVNDNIGCKKYQVIVKMTSYFGIINGSHNASLEAALASKQNDTYITAEFADSHVPTTLELGNGKWYGDYMNQLLVPGMCYQAAIRIVFIKENSKSEMTYSQLSDSWCSDILVPTLIAALEGVNKGTAVKSISIAVGVMVGLFCITFIGWGIYLLCRKRGLIFYSDKFIKGPSLWKVIRGTKLPTIVEQLIKVDYHDTTKYDDWNDEVDLSDGINEGSPKNSETSVEHLYDDPTSDSE